MDPAKQRALTDVLLNLVPRDGTPIGNHQLRQQFTDAAKAKSLKATETQFDALREAIVAEGVLLKGKGPGGSVRRARPGTTGRPPSRSLTTAV